MTTKSEPAKTMIPVRDKDGLLVRVDVFPSDQVPIDTSLSGNVKFFMFGPTVTNANGQYVDFGPTQVASVDCGDGSVAPVLPTDLEQYVPYSSLVIQSDVPFEHRIVTNRNTGRSLVIVTPVSQLDYVRGIGTKRAIVDLVDTCPAEVRNQISQSTCNVDGQTLPLSQGKVAIMYRHSKLVQKIEAAGEELERIYAANLPSDELMVQVVNVYKQLTDAGAIGGFTTADPSTGEKVKYSRGEFASVK